MRNASFIALGLGLSLLGAACADTTGPDQDELAGESSADGDDTKADSNGTYTYYDLTQDQRRCASPMCGGVWVDRVNRAQTACTGGDHGPLWQETCYAADIDWSDSGLSQDQIDQVMAAVYTGESGRVLVRGHLRSNDYGDGLTLGRLYISEAWLAQTDGEPDGVFVKVKDSGVRCIAAPCESNAELKLNSSLSANIAGIDFEPSGATEDVVGQATEAMFEGGMIIAGYRYTVYENGRTARGRRAYQVYLRLVPGAAANPAS